MLAFTPPLLLTPVVSTLLAGPVKHAAGSSTDWPSLAQVLEVALLSNYNTRLVVLSTTILGIASGLIGSFLLLRKRSLMGDALSHACLPGIGLMFLLTVSVGATGKSLALLLLGATVTGIAGVGIVLAIRHTSRIKDDAAMGIVLSVFFGIGVAILAMVQTLPGASAAGLEQFIYGKTASMVMQDFTLISAIALLVVVLCIILFKEFTLLCFDEKFAAAQGMPVWRIDLAMLALVAAVTVIGLQAVGLILIIAFLITPAAAARFWTDNLKAMTTLAAVIGGLSGWLGASLSAILARLPAGAVIVLVAASIFILSMIFGPARGVLIRVRQRRHLHRKVGRQHLLRAAFEQLEQAGDDQRPPTNQSIDFTQLLAHRGWSSPRLRKLIAAARNADDIEYFDGHKLLLTDVGFAKAARITRNHRLWEIYLIQHADIAPAHVDRDADAVEHVLGVQMVQQLEAELIRRGHAPVVPPSPHAIAQGPQSS